MISHLTSTLDNNIPVLINYCIRVILAIVVFLIGKYIINCIRKVVRKGMERSDADVGVRQFIDSLLKFGLYALLIVGIATRLGVESASVAALLASAGVAVGLALQGSLSNFAGGVLILLLKPFKVGDYIVEDTHNNEGTVKEIQIFYTKLSTIDNKTIVIPNGTLANSSLTNVTAKDERLLNLEVSISYDSDLKKAKHIIHQLILDDSSTLKEEEIKVFVSDLADSAVIIGLRAWVKTDEYWETRWRILENVKLALDESGIEIPFNQITVHMPKQNEL